MSWSDGLDRSLCLSTETGTRIGCLQGDPSVAFAGLLLPAGRYRLDVSGTGSLDDRYRIAVTAGAPLPPTGDVEPNDDAATASPVTGAFAVSGDLTGSVPGTGDVFAWTVSEADAARSWRLELSATPGIGGQLGLYGPDGSGLASAQTSPEGTARIFDLRLPAGTYTAWITQSGSASPGYVLRSVEETAPDIDPEPNDVTDARRAPRPGDARRARPHRDAHGRRPLLLRRRRGPRRQPHRPAPRLAERSRVPALPEHRIRLPDAVPERS